MEEEKLVAKVEKPISKTNYLTYGMIAAIVILAATTGWFAWQTINGNNDKKQLQTQVDNLASQIKSQNSAQDSASQKSANVTPTPSTTPTPVISASLKENTIAAIDTMNTAALEGYMAASVNVVIAASEFGGPRTPAQAIGDLAYLNSATAPWDFNLPAATLNAYKAGDYAQYFGVNTIVGKSANNYVVSFGVNNAGKINSVFMAIGDVL